MATNTCDDFYNCCDCGTDDNENGCGCAYCWSCNACESCLNDDDDNYGINQNCEFIQVDIRNKANYPKSEEK